MVYKRFIKKDGKFYGPYEYKSVKQDGKVISEYVGKGVKKELRKKIICSKNCFYAIMILLGILILLQVFVVDLIMTGKATLTTEKTYFPGEQITGSVKLILSEGELIPASSKVVIDNSGDVREFLLSDFLGNETSEGNYHIHEKGISGYGSGYGVLGERIIYPEVDFVLKIVDDVSASGEIISEVAENQSEEIVAEESEVVEESPSESPSIITGEIVDEVENSDSISGSVSKENSFLYNLPDGKTVEIVSSENEINVEVKDGILTVTTDYSEIEEGYGAGFYGKKETEYNINLDELNITANEGIFSVNIFYNEENLVSVQEKINIDYGENETSEIIFAENLTNETIVTNITNETIINLGNTSLKIDTTQYGAVVGMPVKWKKKITAENVSNITVELPKEAENVNVYEIPTENVSAGVDAVSQEITNSGSVSITGQASAELSFGEKSSIVKFFKKIFRSITGRAIDVQEETDTVIVNIDEVNDSVAEYEISYETPAPISIEENISNGKRVIISSDVHYENILAYSELPYEISLNKIKLYYYDDVTGEKVLTNFDAYDSNGDLITGSTPEEKGYENVSVNDLVNVSAGEIPVEQNLVSFITWIVPHTSNQTYEIIIDITNAEHLDSNRTLIENIYNDVKSRDGVWSPTINNGEYVRVTFEQSLTSENDITIYAKSADKNSIANVEIYRENGDERISVIENVSSEGYYKTYLTGLNENENFFDLKIISLSGVEFDYIVDPYTLNLSANGTGSNMTVEPEEIAHLNISDGSLVLYMPFDAQENSEISKTYDYTNNSNDGTLNEEITFNSTGGVYSSGAYYFSGANNGNINLGNSSILKPENFSISLWVRTNVSGNNLGIFTNLDSTANHRTGYSLTRNTLDKIEFRTGDDTNTISNVLSTTIINDGLWYHVVAVYNGTMYLFINGIQEGTPKTVAMQYDELPVYIGSYYASSPALLNMNGSIDEVMMFNRSLSATEIMQIYNSTYSRFYPTGELLFQNLNFGERDKVNMTLNSCQQLNGSSFQGKINDGDYQNFSGCSLGDYLIPGDKTSANLTVKFLASAGNFYSPLVIGNISVTEFRNDTILPTITFENPTPSNNSYTKNSVTIVANVSDSSGQNGSSFIDFDRSLIGYWSFDSYNSTGIYDNSSYGNFGTFTGTGFGSSHISQGARGNGLSFDGSDDYVSIGDLPLFEFKENENFSVFVWIKVLNTTGVKGIVYKGAPGGATPGWHISMSGNRFYSQVQVGSTRVGTTTSACVINSNEWYLVGAVFNRNENAINYINANSCQSYDISSVNGDLASNIVLNLGLFSNYFNGSMDDVMIFNRSLSQSEINALYNSQANKFSATFTGLATGQHNYTLYGVDGAGNVNTSTQNFVVDTEKPVIEFVSPTENDGVTISNPYTYINTSITDNYNSDKSAWIDWDNTLVGYWSFDSYNSTGVFDNSSYGNFGTFTGGIGSSNISQGARGNGLSFDGDGDYVNSISNLGISGNFTLSAWIYPTNVDGYHRIIASRFNDYSLLLNRNKVAYQILNTGHANLSVGSINTNVWTHVLVSFDSSSGRIKFYIDGVEDLSEHTDLRVPSGIEVTFVNIGSTGAGQYFNGSIDEVMIFNRTLSATEISALYNNSAYRYENNFTNLADKGIYNYSVYAIDAGGNLNVTDSRSLDVNLDATAPQITIALPVAGNTYTSADVTFQVTTNENSTCNYSTNSFATNNSMTRNDNGTIHTATATLANANYVVNYSCADLYDHVNSSVGTNFVVSVSSGSSGTTGSSGSGGGGATTTTQDSIKVGTDSIERTLALNKIEFGQIEIRNTGEGNKTFSVSVETINSLIEFEESKITVGAGDSKNFEFRITPPTETGIYTGKIIIVSGSYVKTIPVTLNIRTEKSLYDLIVTIPKSMKVIEPATNLVSQIDLLQMGIKEKMDVTLNYVIKDFTGKVYFSESETIAVENQKTLEKEFHTSDLPDGEYVLGVELIYPDGVAVASSQFKVGQKSLVQKNNIFMILILCALVFVAITIYFVTRKYRRMLKAVRKK
jgi:hypothetical protein